MEKSKEQLFKEQISESETIIRNEINNQINYVIFMVLATILAIYASYVISWFVLSALIVNVIFYHKFQQSKMIYEVETVVLSTLKMGQKLFCN